MNRLDIINSLIKYKGFGSYLEIGVENGHIFFRVNAKYKVAVDPKFLFDRLRIVGKTILNPVNINNRYFEKTSDDFFYSDASSIFSGKLLNIALIDGMHEYKFALRDVENTLKYMDDDGVIIMHDCNPKSATAAGPFSEWTTGEWNGDVWKTILHLRSLRKDLNVFVLDCDQGLGIVTKGKTSSTINLTELEIENLSYADLEKNRENWLDLKPENYFNEFFSFTHS